MINKEWHFSACRMSSLGDKMALVRLDGRKIRPVCYKRFPGRPKCGMLIEETVDVIEEKTPELNKG